MPAAVAFAYAFGHLAWYLDTPLGRVPVLDERENLDLANAIFGGTLPAEPFYRAPGYALMLAGLRALGIAPRGLFSAALALGALLHAVNAGLVARLALRWLGGAAALAAGLLTALNPVFIHYATQALDATPALTLFLVGLNFLARPGAAPASALPWLGASVGWAAASLMRPNYLLVWAVLPVLALTQVSPGARPLRIAASLGGLMLFAGLAIWQGRISGGSGFLPTQGAYNFWAANRPGAHGRYYVQQLDLPPALVGQNPARRESLLLFARETGGPADDLDAANAHWRQRARDEILHHPLAWLGQLTRKGYALLNDWEQYNNKTFAFHHARSPWLRWNRLSWGVIFVLGIAGTVRLHRAAPDATRLLAIVGAAVAVSVVVFFVSARFRLPLAALLCVSAGGALAHPIGLFRELDPPRRRVLTLGLIGAALLTFSNFDGVRDTRPFVQDHLLSARAAQVVGDDAAVWREAGAAQALDPSRRDALEFLVTSGFNRQFGETLSGDELAAWRRSAAQLLAVEATASPAARLIAAVASRDVASLRSVAGESTPAAGDALGALTLLGAADSREIARLCATPPETGSTLFFMARQVLEPEAFEAWAQIHEPAGWSKALASARARLFPPPSASR